MPVKEKNMEFRQNEKNYLTILARLDYFFHLLKEHISKFNNIRWLESNVGTFNHYFPNISSLFFERFILRNLISGIEEGELDDDITIPEGDVSLHDIAQGLSKLGLERFDDSKHIYRHFFGLDYFTDSGSDSGSDSDSGSELDDGPYDDFLSIIAHDILSWAFFYEEIFSKIKII